MSTAESVVFVLDDDPMVLSALSDSIDFLGYEVKAFSTPAACLEEIKTTRCNLLISDVSMPEIRPNIIASPSQLRFLNSKSMSFLFCFDPGCGPLCQT